MMMVEWLLVVMVVAVVVVVMIITASSFHDSIKVVSCFSNGFILFGFALSFDE